MHPSDLGHFSDVSKMTYNVSSGTLNPTIPLPLYSCAATNEISTNVVRRTAPLHWSSFLIAKIARLKLYYMYFPAANVLFLGKSLLPNVQGRSASLDRDWKLKTLICWFSFAFLTRCQVVFNCDQKIECSS